MGSPEPSRCFQLLSQADLTHIPIPPALSSGRMELDSGILSLPSLSHVPLPPQECLEQLQAVWEREAGAAANKSEENCSCSRKLLSGSRLLTLRLGEDLDFSQSQLIAAGQQKGKCFWEALEFFFFLQHKSSLSIWNWLIPVPGSPLLGMCHLLQLHLWFLL